MNEDNKSNLTNQDLTLFAFGYCADKDGFFGGYKHRTSVIDILNERCNLPDYEWDGEFWGPASSEYESHLVEYNFYKAYLSSLDYDKFESHNEPIHHKSQFLIRGLSWWLQTYDKIRENVNEYRDFILDSIVYSQFDSSLVVTRSLLYEPKKIKEIDNVSQKILYPFSWREQKPTPDEIVWLKEQYDKTGLKPESNSPLRVEIPENIVENKFAYLNPEKTEFDKFVEDAKNKLDEDSTSSAFIVETIKDKVISKTDLDEHFEEVKIEFNEKFDIMCRAYDKEIKKIQEIVKGKEFILNFGDKTIDINCDKKLFDPYTYRYCWHILQPLELIQYYRDMIRSGTPHSK